MVKELQQRIALYNDMEAYKELYHLFFPTLFRFSLTIVKSREAAEEIVSDVFIKIWQLREGLVKVNDLKVYLYVITKNFSLNYVSRVYKNPVINLDRIEVDSIVTENSAEDNLITMEMRKKINAAIAELPNQCKIIFLLVKEDGLKYHEAAAILDISVLTVRNQVAIAIRKIAASLKLNMNTGKPIHPRFSTS